MAFMRAAVSILESTNIDIFVISGLADTFVSGSAVYGWGWVWNWNILKLLILNQGLQTVKYENLRSKYEDLKWNFNFLDKRHK